MPDAGGGVSGDYDREAALDRVAEGLAPIASRMAGEEGFPDREAQAVLDWVYEERHKRLLPVDECYCEACVDAAKFDDR